MNTNMNTRHWSLLFCASFIGLAHSFTIFLPNKNWNNVNKVNGFVHWSSSSSLRLAGDVDVDVDVDGSLQQQSTTTQGTFTESPEAVFHRLVRVNENKDDDVDDTDTSVVGFEELKQWGELQGLLSEEDITQTELEEMVAKASITTNTNNHNDDTEIINVDGGNNKNLDKAGFVLLYNMIDDLFDYEDEDGDDEDAAEEEVGVVVEPPNTEDVLISFLRTGIVQSVDGTVDQPEEFYKLPCGMECTDAERDVISQLVRDLCGAPNNRVVATNGNIVAKDLLGEWDLLYTSSNAMILNKSISGLTGTPGVKTVNFSGVRQKFTGSK